MSPTPHSASTRRGESTGPKMEFRTSFTWRSGPSTVTMRPPVKVPGATPLLRARKIRPLAVTSRGRARLLPETPSLNEAGYPSYELYNWVGIFAPGKTSADIVGWYAQEIAKVTASADFREKFERVGLDLVQNDTPAAFSDFVKKEIASWTRLIQAAGIQPE